MHESRIGGQRSAQRTRLVGRRKRGQAPFAGTALRVLRTKGACPLFLFGQVEQPLLGVGAPFGVAQAAAAAEMVADFAPRHGPQPSAEALLGRFAAKPPRPGGHGGEHLLHHVGRIRAAHAQLPTPAVNHRSIEIDQPLPSLGPPRANLVE